MTDIPVKEPPPQGGDPVKKPRAKPRAPAKKTYKPRKASKPGKPRAIKKSPAAELDAVKSPPRGEENINRPLSEQQRRFVNHLVRENMGPTVAARLAGYSFPNVAYASLLKNAKVQAAIADEREAFAKATQMTKQKVVDGFMEAISIARIKADPVAMISGWRELGKMCGFYEPTRTQLEISMNGKVLLQQLNSMSDEELLALAEKEMNTLDGEYSVVEPEG